ncbi:TLD-domain-containing protein [Polychaeton citri CBS 116435]|uniref:Oxidation resistance protein 1 n=1 Tax=Polychaeton citri CBS 116435 TaxID=1314669 RepID=A0A9P4PYM8_9PEZI|nr:TLD-domain-containing protein [Polychaeton citri CBS 116435]
MTSKSEPPTRKSSADSSTPTPGSAADSQPSLTDPKPATWHPLIDWRYYTNPVAYTVSSVVRRISVDDAPTPLARALSANYNGSIPPSTPGMTNSFFANAKNGVFNPSLPPQRRASPFQPPPLSPLHLRGYKSSTTHRARILSRALAEEIRLLVPARLQLADNWSLLYSLEQDGSTLSTLYSRCEPHTGKRGGFVLVIRDGNGGIFGAYLSEPPRPGPHYFGSGECFLWRAVKLPALPDLSSLPPPPSEDTTHAQRMTTIGGISRNSSSTSLAPSSAANGNKTPGTATPDRIRFKAFPYTGENDFCAFCQQDYLSVGGGDGHYGLWLDDALSSGVSEPCPTFGNEALSDEGTKFEVLGVEMWYIG